MKPMKTKIIILFVALVVSLSNVAQVDFLLDPDVKVYQSRGTNFITLALDNNEVFIKEYDESGEELWSDSYQIALDSLIERTTFAGLFKGTSDFIIVHQQSLTNTSKIGLDTNAIHIVKLSLDDYTLELPIIDTLGGGYFLFNPMTDSTFNIYAHSQGDEIQGEPTYYETWSLNREMELTLKAHRDSIIGSTFGANIFEVRDTLYFLRSDYAYTWGRKYSQEISYIEDIPNYGSASNLMTTTPVVNFRQPINEDTLFVFVWSSMQGGATSYWQFDFFDMNLNLYSQTVFPAPSISTQYTSHLYPRAVNFADEKIYILASYSSSHEGQAVYVYDLEINELCVLPMSALGISSESSNNHMVKLNNKMYVARGHGYGYIMSEIDCEKLVSLEGNEKNNQVNIFPNPSNEKFTISSESAITHLVIYDNMGRTIFQKNYTPQIFTDEVKLQSSGVYHFQMQTNGGILNRKVVVD
jgi:hypothetical protein